MGNTSTKEKKDKKNKKDKNDQPYDIAVNTDPYFEPEGVQGDDRKNFEEYSEVSDGAECKQQNGKVINFYTIQGNHVNIAISDGNVQESSENISSDQNENLAQTTPVQVSNDLNEGIKPWVDLDFAVPNHTADLLEEDGNLSQQNWPERDDGCDRQDSTKVKTVYRSGQRESGFSQNGSDKEEIYDRNCQSETSADENRDDELDEDTGRDIENREDGMSQGSAVDLVANVENEDEQVQSNMQGQNEDGMEMDAEGFTTEDVKEYEIRENKDMEDNPKKYRVNAHHVLESISKISDVGKVGMCKTYDIAMKSENNNQVKIESVKEIGFTCRDVARLMANVTMHCFQV